MMDEEEPGSKELKLYRACSIINKFRKAKTRITKMNQNEKQYWFGGFSWGVIFGILICVFALMLSIAIEEFIL